jgi:holo-[acyl-carrier protein] synthase
MIYGIGVDLVKIARLSRALERFGDRFRRRIFTPQEIAYCESRGRPESCYALRFAAKEAFAKALGVGLRQGGIRWPEVEVVSTPSGRPDLQVHGQAAHLCSQAGVKGMLVSLTDEAEYGVAVVVLEI